jgi:hypothetical protein
MVFMDLKDFEKDLVDAENGSGNAERFEDVHLGYIDDVLDALAWTRAAITSKEELEASSSYIDWSLKEPYITRGEMSGATIRALVAAAGRRRNAASAPESCRDRYSPQRHIAAGN